MLSFDSPRPLT